VGLIYLLLIVHVVAQSMYLYWTFWWFDILMHFLGGLWVGLFGLWFVYVSGYVVGTWKSRVRPFWVALGSVVLIGLLWEVYEYANHLIFSVPFLPQYPADTLLDMVMDGVGAVFGWLLYRRFRPLLDQAQEKENTTE